MKLVAYLRVSTDRQAEEGLGLDVQERAIRGWARENRHRIVLWSRDEGVSGSNGLEEREGLAEALAALRDGLADGLAVYRLDRLARDLVLQETLLADIWRMGRHVFSTARGESDLQDDPTDPSRKLIRQVLGAVAEYERAMIALRMRAGRKLKADRGGFAYGSPAYGYKARNRALEPDEEEQKALALIRRLHTEGASLRAIAAALEEAGHRPKRSGKWHPETLRRIVGRL